MPTSVDLRQQRQTLWARMKEINDGAEAENRSLTPEEDANWAAATTDINALDVRIQRQEVLERAPVAGETRKLETAVLPNLSDYRKSDQYKDAYRSWLRSGNGITSEEREALEPGRKLDGYAQYRALSTVSGTGGGFAVAPNDFGAAIEAAMAFYGGMLEAGTIIDTGDGADLPFPTSNDTANVGELVAENNAVTEQDVTFGRVMLKAFMYSSKLVRVPIQLMQDSAFDVEGFLSDRFGERLGRIQNTDFTIGTGGNSPTGIMLDSVQGVAGATGQSTTVTWDDLISLEHSVNIAYRRGGRFMYHDNTLQALRKLKDGNGQYLWQPGANAQAPSTIMSYPYIINNDVAAMAASANSIVFGQLQKYHIRRVRGFTLLRLEELYAASLPVGVLAFSRVDGKLIDAGGNPVKHYTNSAS